MKRHQTELPHNAVERNPLQAQQKGTVRALYSRMIPAVVLTSWILTGCAAPITSKGGTPGVPSAGLPGGIPSGSGMPGGTSSPSGIPGGSPGTAGSPGTPGSPGSPGTAGSPGMPGGSSSGLPGGSQSGLPGSQSGAESGTSPEGTGGTGGTERSETDGKGTSETAQSGGGEWETSNQLPDSGKSTGKEGTDKGQSSGGQVGMGADRELQAALEDIDGSIKTERDIIRSRSQEEAGTRPAPDVASGGAGNDSLPAGDAAPAVVPRNRNVPPPSVAGGNRNLPGDLPDAKDDDIIARQLREAAMSETDPELKAKLWEEYKRYKDS